MDVHIERHDVAGGTASFVALIDRALLGAALEERAANAALNCCLAPRTADSR